MNEAIDITGMELVPTRAHSRTLFFTDDPAEVLVEAGKVANALKGALQAGGMVQKIGSNEHVKIDGWQTLGAMLGVSAYIVWSRRLEVGDGWEARAEARTGDGRVVGAAEAMVTSSERNWRNSDDYALRSMAQTRAMSKALRGPLGFVITLAGHDATPAEEAIEAGSLGGLGNAAELPAWAQPGDPAQTAGQLIAVLKAMGDSSPEPHAIEIGNAILAACDGDIPVCVADTIRLLAARATPDVVESQR